jgi:hypothetical protein
MEVVRAGLKEQCRMRLPPTTNEHRRDRISQPVSLRPLRSFGLLKRSIARLCVVRKRMQSATLHERMAGRGRGWAEFGELSNRLWERQSEYSTGARSWISNSQSVVDGTAMPRAWLFVEQA